MKGTEVTREQMREAADFFERVAGPTVGDGIAMPKDDLIRMLAWYGALRYQAAEKGIGTLETPGDIIGKAEKPN